MVRSRLGFICGCFACSAAFGTSAHADNFNYPNFSNTAGLTFAGNAGTAVTGDGTVLRIIPAAGNQAGAAYSTTSTTLGTGATFSTQFSFRFTQPGGVDPADGITFVLAASPSGLGTAGYGMGYQGVANSVAIEFDTYNNGNANSLGPFPQEPDSSNHVAIDLNGALTNANPTNVYGISSCGFPSGTPSQSSNAVAGCMSNGDLWTATITYDGSLLNVVLSDPAEGSIFNAITNLPIDIASYLGGNTAYVGFTGSSGAGWENEDITSWRFADTATLPPAGVPEPATWATMLLGFAGIGMAVRRRRRVPARLA
jgi:Legume lectin domain/PEP-CTERM motif